MEAYRSVGTTTRLKGEWFDTMTIDEIEEVFDLLYCLLKPHKHLYIFSNALALWDLNQALENTGYTYNNLLIWDKMRMGMGYSYRGQCEFMIFASKEKKEQLIKNPPHIFRVPKEYGSPPYAKPWRLYWLLLQCFAKPGDHIIDPWAGTDPLTKAAMVLGLRSTSIDINYPVEHLVVPPSIAPLIIKEN